MNAKFFKFSNRFILYLFNILFFLTLIFAITSPNIIVGDNKITGAGTTMFTSLFLIGLISLILAIIVYPRVRHFFWLVFIKYQKRTAWILFSLVILWQLIFVLCVHPPIGFDVGAIHEGLINTSDMELRVYFSLYYNNIALLLIQHYLTTLFSTTSWLFLDLVTMLVVDLAAFFNFVTIAIVDRRKLPLAVYIHAVWLFIFPTIIVPYTDAWVLPLVSGYLMSYCFVRSPKFKLWLRIIMALIFGLLVAGTYFMKPSAIVPVVAIVMIEVIFWLKKQTFNDISSLKKISIVSLILPFLCVASIFAGYYQGQKVINNQNYIIVNRLRGVPVVHYLSMGLSGDGGYNPKDALAMARLVDKKARTTYSKRLLIKRLKKMGPLGYAKFLFNKHRNDTADGTFAWVKEGHFINENPRPKGTGFAGYLRQFVYLYGTHLGDFRFISQLWWIIWLFMIAFGWHNHQKFVQLLRLAIIGGFLYLLLFEGGRSRYLIQFLPAFLLLATLVADDSWRFFKNLYRAAFKKATLPKHN